MRAAYRRFLSVLPEAAAHLGAVAAAARLILVPDLRRQAEAALRDKRFHIWGGAALLIGVPARHRRDALEAMVAIQTISDYLDNLVDRGAPLDLGTMRSLHRAMVDAVTPGAALRPYYGDGPGEDVYLPALVRRAETALGRLPGYGDVEGLARRAARRYSALQVLKHLHPDHRRGEALIRWQRRRRRSPLLWWERAAAAGSTLPLFGLIAEAGGDASARFWRTAGGEAAAALHILLDYAIDRDEDRREGDYNLTAPAGPLGRVARRMGFLARLVGRLPEPHVALAVLGLPALYLSDPKALRWPYAGLLVRTARALGPGVLLLWGAALVARRSRFRRLEQLVEQGG